VTAAPPVPTPGPSVPARADRQEAFKRARIAQNKRLAEWDDNLVGAGHGIRVLILKGVWAPSELEALSDPADVRAFFSNLRQDMRAECGKSGPVEKVTVFEGHEEGVVAVKFRTPEAAEVCQALMQGRRFGGRQLTAEFFDGHTNYKCAARPGGAAAARGDGGDGGGGSESEEEGMDSHAEQQRRLEAMASQLDAQSSDGSDEDEVE
jgi:HIV Tat-specific factor 1